MKIFRTLFWTAIVAIVVERCRAEFLLVEIDDAPVKMDEVDGIGKEDETLVVNSKLNPDTLVVESHVEGAKDSTIEGAKDSADIREVTDERLVVKSKLKPNTGETLVVQSDIVVADDSTEIGEVADEKEIRLTPRQC